MKPIKSTYVVHFSGLGRHYQMSVWPQNSEICWEVFEPSTPRQGYFYLPRDEYLEVEDSEPIQQP